MHVLSAVEMQVCDRLTTEKFGVSSLDLMRAASLAVASFARSQFPRARRVTILCGKGNNGGDGMMAARELAHEGLEVTTLLLGSPEELKGDAATAWRELATSEHCLIHVVNSAADLAEHNDALQTDLIIDAVFGTGFKPPMTTLAVAVLEWIKGRDAPVLSVDVPTGWVADAMSATITGPVYPSDAVITFTAPKPAHVFGQLTRHGDQPVVVASIGSPREAIVSTLDLDWAGSSLALAQAPRASGSNKGNFGHVLVVGGSFGSAGGKAGAPAMTSLGALRAGAGLVTAAVPAPAMRLVSAAALELMTWSLTATTDGQIAAENLDPNTVAALIKGKTVLAIGPGLGQSPDTAKFTIGLLSMTTMPVVIDADALNILSSDPGLLPKLALTKQGKRAIVLTPHPGEMARLLNRTVADVQAHRVEIARSFAIENGVTLVLKGARTLIAHPNGRVAVNTSGNPGMAKGGSGDLLTGIVAGLLAQHPNDVERAVEAAVYLHGLAADMALRGADEHTLLATDSLAHLARAFQFPAFHFRNRSQTGYVWLQGLPAESSFAAASREAAQ